MICTALLLLTLLSSCFSRVHLIMEGKPFQLLSLTLSSNKTQGSTVSSPSSWPGMLIACLIEDSLADTGGCMSHLDVDTRST